MTKDIKFSAAAFIALLSLALMMIPMPKWIVDLLFTFNIAAGLIVLLAALRTEKALDFSIFPAGLLLLTLLRLSLNVASTRLILGDGHQGGEAAGKVIEAFGKVLLGGNFVIGLMLFAILLIINFVVITKGAGRIAEVSARFALDSLPGKQMAIDADLSAGLIGEAQAKERREEVGREADFYGSMDGASKFVRGDALAAMLIFFLSSIGGVIIGVVSHNLSFSKSAAIYIPMTVGDAIASQVPALLLSIAAAVIVSKSGSKGDLSDTMLKQIGKAGPIKQAGMALILLGLLPHMPHVSFILFGVGLFVMAQWTENKNQKENLIKEAQEKEKTQKEQKKSEAQKDLSWDDISAEEPIAMEIGYKLIALADASQGGDFLVKARALRKKFAEQWGFVPPALRVRDNLELAPGHARILIRGTEVAKGDFYTDRLLCLKESVDHNPWPMPGIETVDPAFGLPALWIEKQHESMARAMGFAVIQPSAALATLFSKTLNDHAKVLFGMGELKGLLEWKFKDQKNITEWVPGQISFSLLLKICKELLEEGVPLKDFESLLAEICILIKKTDDPLLLAEQARKGVLQHIAMEAFGDKEGLGFILDENLEKIVTQALTQGQAIEPKLAQHLIEKVKQKIQEEEAKGNRLVLVVGDKVRQSLGRLLRKSAGDLRVLSFSEIPDGWKINIAGVIN